MNHMPGSSALFDAGQTLLPGGVSSPMRTFAEVDTGPVFIESGKGSQVIDADGNEYVDFICGLGPLILGHAPDSVTAAVCRQVVRGTLFGAPTELEYRLAAVIQKAIPFLERLRFVCSGTEAVMTAVRLAKACTGREKILRFNGAYHGHADTLLGRPPAATGARLRSNAGVPDAINHDTIIIEYNDLDGIDAAFAEHAQEIAAVVVEPYACNMGLVKPLPGFLSALRYYCDAAGSLLIADEVVTGFRLRYGSACDLHEIVPDLVTLGKIIGGGLSIGAYGGKAEFMERVSQTGVFQGGTFAGNPLAMAAGLAALEELSTTPVYTRLEDLGAYLERQLTSAFAEYSLPYSVTRCASLLTMILVANNGRWASVSDTVRQDVALFSRFHTAMLRRGHLMAPTVFEPLFISSAHTKEELAAFARDAGEVLASAGGA